MVEHFRILVTRGAAFAILIALQSSQHWGCADEGPPGDLASSSREKQLALKAHAKAIAIDGLPRFYLRGSGKTAIDYEVKNSVRDPLEQLIQALDPDVPDEDWNVREEVFAWDEKHYFHGEPSTAFSAPDQPKSTVAQGIPGFKNIRWGSSNLSAQRFQGINEPAQHVLRDGPGGIWEDAILTTPNYVVATPHEFWWYDKARNYRKHFRRYFSGGCVPPELATYRNLGVDEFDGETCDVVGSLQRAERLWISRDTGFIRGFASVDAAPKDFDFHRVEKVVGRSFATPREFLDWYRAEHRQLSAEKMCAIRIAYSDSMDWKDTRAPELIIRFRDFREIAPDVWWPFREDRAQGRLTDNGFSGMVINYTVHTIRTDFDLTATAQALLPKEGELVQDQRYAIPVNYEFRADRTKAEILRLVDDASQ